MSKMSNRTAQFIAQNMLIFALEFVPFFPNPSKWDALKSV